MNKNAMLLNSLLGVGGAPTKPNTTTIIPPKAKKKTTKKVAKKKTSKKVMPMSCMKGGC